MKKVHPSHMTQRPNESSGYLICRNCAAHNSTPVGLRDLAAACLNPKPLKENLFRPLSFEQFGS